jgi:hypothetical protein
MPPPSEHQIQSGFFQWVRLAEKTDWRLKLLFAVPNGGLRSAKTAGMLWAEGVRAGVPDIMFPFPAGPFCGLAIEFKRPRKTTSEAQDEYIDLLINAGWMAVICTDAEAAVRTVQDYLRMQ